MVTLAYSSPPGEMAVGRPTAENLQHACLAYSAQRASGARRASAMPRELRGGALTAEIVSFERADSRKFITYVIKARGRLRLS